MTPSSTTALIWSIADLLRGDFKQSDYGRIILPFTLLRRLDCTLAQRQVVGFSEESGAGTASTCVQIISADVQLSNTSSFAMPALLNDPDNIKANLISYLHGFSANIRLIFERYEFEQQIEKLARANLLFHLVSRFVTIDLSPRQVSSADMGVLFEALIRHFAEQSHDTGEHFTPPEVVRLMAQLILVGDSARNLTVTSLSIYDPAAGTGGMLAIAEEHMRSRFPNVDLHLFGQELNDESYAICAADLLIRGHDPARMVAGNTLSADGHAERRFDYMLSNPPFGVDWKKVEALVRREYKDQGYAGRFGPGLPRVSDGSLLFLLHAISKMRPGAEGGSRIAIVLNGSPLFTGGAGSGESNIRKWIIENDWLEAIIALPTDLFYNTSIATYIWIVTNRKSTERAGKIQLINAAGWYEKLRRNLGSKRRVLNDGHIQQILQMYAAFEQNEESKIVDNTDFGYATITVERPLRNEQGEIERDGQGNPRPDPSLRDTERVPLRQNIEDFFQREVLPHVPDAWIDHRKTRMGYEIPFTRFFFKYVPPRSLEAIDADLRQASAEVMELMEEILTPRRQAA